jgi:hypothetical protein
VTIPCTPPDHAARQQDAQAHQQDGVEQQAVQHRQVANAQARRRGLEAGLMHGVQNEGRGAFHQQRDQQDETGQPEERRAQTVHGMGPVLRASLPNLHHRDKKRWSCIKVGFRAAGKRWPRASVLDISGGPRRDAQPTVDRP